MRSLFAASHARPFLLIFLPPIDTQPKAPTGALALFALSLNGVYKHGADYKRTLHYILHVAVDSV